MTPRPHPRRPRRNLAEPPHHDKEAIGRQFVANLAHRSATPQPIVSNASRLTLRAHIAYLRQPPAVRFALAGAAGTVGVAGFAFGAHWVVEHLPIALTRPAPAYAAAPAPPDTAAQIKHQQWPDPTPNRAEPVIPMSPELPTAPTADRSRAMLPPRLDLQVSLNPALEIRVKTPLAELDLDALDDMPVLGALGLSVGPGPDPEERSWI